MTSHVHMILGSTGQQPLEGIIRDMKSFTSGRMRKFLEDKDWTSESRRDWIYDMMRKAGLKNRNNKDFQFWQQHSHPITLGTQAIFDQKLEYIHMNPVTAGFVDRPEAWLYSSTGEFIEGKKGMVDLMEL